MAEMVLKLEVDATTGIARLKDFSRATAQGAKKSVGAWNNVKKAALGASAAYGLVKAFQFSGSIIKQAADIQAGFIGVAKTTGMSSLAMKTFRGEIFNLAKTMTGVDVTELQSVATVAGQLGIKGSKDLTEFTRVAAMLGVATEFSAEQAALTFGQLKNIFHEPISNLEKMGSIVTALGNNVAGSEPKIAEFARRIGVAGKQIGLTTPQIFALSGTLVDVGANAEMGGSAVSQILTLMLKKTKAFAEASGVSLAKYTETINTKPVEAVKTLFAQISKLDKFKRVKVLKNLGLDGIRTSMVMGLLSSNIDLLDKSLKIANTQWRNGTALQKEFDTASKSLNAQIKSFYSDLKIQASVMTVKYFPIFSTIIDKAREAIPLFASLATTLATATAGWVAFALAIKGTAIAMPLMASSLPILTANLTSLLTVTTGIAPAITGVMPAVTKTAISLKSLVVGLGLVVSAFYIGKAVGDFLNKLDSVQWAAQQFFNNTLGPAVKDNSLSKLFAETERQAFNLRNTIARLESVGGTVTHLRKELALLEKRKQGILSLVKKVGIEGSSTYTSIAVKAEAAARATKNLASATDDAKNKTNLIGVASETQSKKVTAFISSLQFDTASAFGKIELTYKHDLEAFGANAEAKKLIELRHTQQLTFLHEKLLSNKSRLLKRYERYTQESLFRIEASQRATATEREGVHSELMRRMKLGELGYFKTFQLGINDSVGLTKTSFEKMYGYAQQWGTLLKSNFKSVFEDGLNGELKTSQEYYNAFRRGVNSIIAGMLADYVAAEVVKRVQSLTTTTVLSANSATAAVAQSSAAATAATVNVTAATATEIAWTAAYAAMTLGISLVIVAVLTNFNKIMSAVRNVVNAFASAGKLILNFFKPILDLIQSILKAIKSLASALGNLNPFGGGGGGLLGGVGKVFKSVPIIGGLFHSGGMVTSMPAVSRAVSPMVFANAPRYHSGGYAGLKRDEHPAILQTGERVQSRDEVGRILNSRTSPTQPIQNRIENHIYIDGQEFLSFITEALTDGRITIPDYALKAT